MAIPLAAVLGALKAALKRALASTLATIAKDNLTKTATVRGLNNIKNLAKGKISDSEALLFNRLKTKPSKELYKYMSRELGIPEKQMRDIVKSFRQTPRMRELAIGTKFKEFAKRSIKKEAKKGTKQLLSNLKLGKNFRISDIIRKTKQLLASDNTQDVPRQDFINKSILSMLKFMNIMVNQKLNGISGAIDKNGNPVGPTVNFEQYFNKDLQYTEENFSMLQDIIEQYDSDLDFYLNESGDEPYLVETRSRVWSRYTERSALKFIVDVEKDVQIALTVD